MQTQETVKTSNQIADALKKAASTNKDIYNVCLVFAMRERTRFEVNVQSLRATMSLEGYEMTVKQIEDVLIFFASLGIGKLNYDQKKRLKGLTEVRWTLQSIGQVSLGNVAGIKRSVQQRKFDKLPTESATEQVPVIRSNPPKHQVSLLAKINGNELNFPLELTSEALLELMAKINANKKGQ